MESATRGIFLCPECGAAAVADRSGSATCSSCEAHFQIPEETKSRTTPILPRGLSRGSGASGGGMVRRNIAPSKTLDGGSFGKTAPSEVPREKETSPREEGVVAGESEREFIPAQPSGDGEAPMPERRRRKKKRDRPKLSFRAILLLGVAWLGLVGLVFFVVMTLKRQFGQGDELSRSLEERLSGEEKAFFRAEYPAVQRTLIGFLQSDTPELKSDVSLNVPQLGRMMRRHYVDNSDEVYPVRMKREPLFWNVAFEESPGFVEVVFDGGGRDQIEAVFVKEDDGWLLDWEHFVRYSTQNWTLFHRRVGNDEEGIFRVYVEKVSESQQEEAPWVKIRFYGPYYDERRRKVEVSPVIMIEADDPLSGPVDHLFADRSGDSAGFSKLWTRDPKELRRVTVKLAWHEDPITGEDRLVLKEVLSHHWRTRSPLADSRPASPSNKSKEEETNE